MTTATTEHSDQGTERNSAVSQTPDSQPSANESGDRGATDKSLEEKILQSIGGKVQGQNILIAGTVQGSIHQQLSDEGRAHKLTLEGNFELWDEARLGEERARLHFDPDHTNLLAARLKERRILILAGEPEIGKASLALLVASSFGTLLSSTDERLQETALCRHIPGRLRVDLPGLGREEQFRRRILIFKNPFASGNDDILRFVAQLSDSRLESYVTNLRRNNFFLLLTADLPGLPGSRDRLKGLGILEDVAKPSGRDLEEGLRRLIERFVGERGISAGDPLWEKVNRLIGERGSLLRAELGSLPRLARFVREYLIDVAEEPELLPEALKRTADLSHWLLEELSREPEVWCTVVALTLCAADRGLEGIPWFEFDTLQRALFRFLRRELPTGLKRREIHDLCRVELTLKRARAEVVPASYPRREVVRFLDERYADRLWQALLGPGKGVAAGLVPLLRQLTSDPDPYLRESAAQALGRIGRIDPFYITYPLINQWLDPADSNSALDRGTLLGSLFEGIWSANEDMGYQQGCLRVLRSRARVESSRTLRVVIFSLYKIALIDQDGFELALGLLKEVAEKRLKMEWRVLQDVTKEFRTDEQLGRLVEFVFKTRGEVEEVRKKAEQALHELAVSDVEILNAFSYSLLRLLFEQRLQCDVLRRLLDWVQTSSDQLAPLTAFIFLGEGGIASWLNWTVSGRKVGSGRDEEGSPLLEAIRYDPDLVTVLAALVEALFVQIRAFPGLLRGVLERNFLRLLAGWASEGRTFAHLQGPVTELLSHLYASRDEELSERIIRLAQESAAAPEFEDLRVLVIEAITGRRGRGYRGEQGG